MRLPNNVVQNAEEARRKDRETGVATSRCSSMDQPGTARRLRKGCCGRGWTVCIRPVPWRAPLLGSAVFRPAHCDYTLLSWYHTSVKRSMPLRAAFWPLQAAIQHPVGACGDWRHYYWLARGGAHGRQAQPKGRVSHQMPLQVRNISMSTSASTVFYEARRAHLAFLRRAQQHV